MSTPLVSVIIPTYNAEAYIEQAIRSVLQQTLQDFEVVVVDDLSSDGSNAVIAALAREDGRIRHFPGRRNLGPGGARNAAIDRARGEWIAVLDADDWFEPTRLERLVNAADLVQVPLACDNQKFISGADGSWRQLLVEQSTTQLKCLDANDLLRGDRLRRNARNLGLLKPLVRRAFLQEHDIRYDDQARAAMGEDFYFLLQCLRYTKHMVFVSDPLYNYRTYAPLTYSKSQSINAFLAIRALHERHDFLFRPDEAPITVRLMERRKREIERYIRFKQFAEPLKQGRMSVFLRQALHDPGGVRLLLSQALSDPGAIVLLSRYLSLHARMRIAGSLQRRQKT